MCKCASYREQDGICWGIKEKLLGQSWEGIRGRVEVVI